MVRLVWSFDSVVLAAVAVDLEPLIGSIVARAAQPDRDEIVLTFRGRSRSLHVLWSIHPRWARVHLVEGAPSGQAGSFCQLLRARLEGARLHAVVQPPFERTVILRFEHVGEPVNLVAEIMGRHSNLIAVQTGTVLGALKTVTSRMSSVRPVTAGSPFIPLPRERPLPQELSVDSLSARLGAGEGPVARRLADATIGLSPLLATELCVRAGLDPAAGVDALNEVAAALWPALTDVMEMVRVRRFDPVLYRRGSVPVGFAPFPYQYLAQFAVERMPTMSRAVATAAASLVMRSALDEERQALQAAIAVAIERLTRTEAELQKVQAEAARAEELRQQGDLLFAYVAQVPPGASEVTLPGFDGTPVRIPLDPTLSAVDNARRLFTRLRRIRSAQPEVARRLTDVTERRAYLENALALVETATSPEDVRSMREELVDEHVLTPRRRTPRRPRVVSTGPRRFTSTTGHHILVGRTNRENDEVTFTHARPDDVWLHARGMPGAHVVVRADGRPIPDAALAEAAQIAAYFSRGRTAKNVEVSYTLRKYVKKPRGARPGLVAISNEKTILVEPNLPRGTDPDA